MVCPLLLPLYMGCRRLCRIWKKPNYGAKTDFSRSLSGLGWTGCGSGRAAQIPPVFLLHRPTIYAPQNREHLRSLSRSLVTIHLSLQAPGFIKLLVVSGQWWRAYCVSTLINYAPNPIPFAFPVLALVCIAAVVVAAVALVKADYNQPLLTWI